MTKQTYRKRRKTNKLRKLTKKVGGGWWPFGKSKSQKIKEFRSKFLDLLIADYMTDNNPNYYDTILNTKLNTKLLADFNKNLPESKKYMKQFLETRVEAGINSTNTADKEYAYSFLRDMIQKLNNEITAIKKDTHTPSQMLISNYTFRSPQVFYDITHTYYKTLKDKKNLTSDEVQYINDFDKLTGSSQV